MEIILDHRSSLEFWRIIRPYEATRKLLAHRCEPPRLRDSIQNRKPTIADIEKVEHLGLSLCSRPLHLMVSSDSARARRRDFTCSVYSKNIPRSSFVKAEKSLYVMSPELCFVLEAQKRPLANLIELGFELCGTYRMPLSSKECSASSQPPLTSILKLQNFVERSRGLNGVEKARRALPHIIPASDSPKETHLAMLSCMPGRLGGYGFPQAKLNSTVFISEKARGRGVGHTCRCDLYWPEVKLDVEYDSTLHHADGEKQAKDSARRTALAYEGILVISVTSTQLHTRQEMDKVAQAMAKRMGRRLRPKAADWRTKQIQLRTQLLANNNLCW